MVDLGDDVGGRPDGRLALLLGIERAGGGRFGGERFVGWRDLRQDRSLRECCRHPCRTPASAGRFTVWVEVYAFSGVSRDISLVPGLACSRASGCFCVFENRLGTAVFRDRDRPQTDCRPSSRRRHAAVVASIPTASGSAVGRPGRRRANRVRGGLPRTAPPDCGVDHGVHGLSHRARAASVPARNGAREQNATLRDDLVLPDPHSVTPPQKPPQDCGKTRITVMTGVGGT